MQTTGLKIKLLRGVYNRLRCFFGCHMRLEIILFHFDNVSVQGSKIGPHGSHDTWEQLD